MTRQLKGKSDPPTAVQLRNRACTALGVRLDQLQGESRHPKVMQARRVVSILLRDAELLPLETIADMVRPGVGHSSAWTMIRDGRKDAGVMELVGRIAKEAKLLPALGTTLGVEIEKE